MSQWQDVMMNRLVKSAAFLAVMMPRPMYELADFGDPWDYWRGFPARYMTGTQTWPESECYGHHADLI